MKLQHFSLFSGMRYSTGILLLIGIYFPFWSLATTILPLTDDFDYQYVGTHLATYEDVADTVSLKEIVHFKNWQTQYSSKFTSKALTARLWIKLTVKNQTDQTQALSLVVENPLLEAVQFYNFEKDRLVDTSLLMGNAFPFTQRTIQHRYPIYSFQLAPNQETTIYGSLVEDSEYTPVHLKLYKQAYLLPAIQTDLIYKILLLSPLILLTFISLLWLLFNPQLFTLFFTLKCIVALLFLLGLEGIGFQYLWSNLLFFQKSFPVHYLLYHIFLALTLHSFFGMDKKTASAKLLYTAILVQVLAFLYTLFIISTNPLINDSVLPRLSVVLSLSSIGSYISILLACLNFYHATKNKEMFSILWLLTLQLVVGSFISVSWLANIHFQKYISGFELFTGIGMIQIIAILSITVIYYHKKTTAFEKVEFQLSQKQNEALHNLLKGQENERKRLSRELHDGLSIRMLQVKQGLGTFKSDLNLNRFTTVIKEIDTIHQDIRNLSHALNPTVLQEYGLKKAINDIIFNIEINNLDLDIHFEYPDNLPLDKEQEKHFYYIIQELLNNTVKYAKASYVYIEFKKMKDRLFLYYFDNGSGYDPNNLTTTGIGLNNIRSRVALLNGHFKITPRKPKGIEHNIYIACS